MGRTHFTELVISLIKDIPAGRISTYGTIAALAGNPRAARQVARILHSCSSSASLPWHRVINSQGKISMTGADYARQKDLLVQEGIIFDKSDRIDLGKFLWSKW
ncbi:MGMT family protein [Oleidesulfovibrio sp.]|uniref:MGMT family protein n=1 Tax=Oleidesulfovibrio sp. TaxID=2909707 RepID=UPI003A86839C